MQTLQQHVLPEQPVAQTKTQDPKCKDCNFRQDRIERGLLFQTVLAFLPVRRYYCAHCRTKRYYWGRPTEE